MIVVHIAHVPGIYVPTAGGYPIRIRLSKIRLQGQTLPPQAAIKMS